MLYSSMVHVLFLPPLPPPPPRFFVSKPTSKRSFSPGKLFHPDSSPFVPQVRQLGEGTGVRESGHSGGSFSLTCMYPVAACTRPDAPPKATTRCNTNKQADTKGKEGVDGGAKVREGYPD